MDTQWDVDVTVGASEPAQFSVQAGQAVDGSGASHCGHCIKASRQAGHVVMANLGGDKIKVAWGALHAWYKENDPVASKPCYKGF